MLIIMGFTPTCLDITIPPSQLVYRRSPMDEPDGHQLSSLKWRNIV